MWEREEAVIAWFFTAVLVLVIIFALILGVCLHGS